MATTPTFALPATFLGIAAADAAASRFQIAGIPFDLGVTNRSGARQGPAAIRTASRMLVDGDNPRTWTDPSSCLDIADIGNFALALGDIAQSMALIETQARTCSHLVSLGGDHTISLALLRALAARTGGPLALVHFDAHVDTWPDNFGATIAHGSVFFHAITEGLVDPKRMIQIGIRSPVSRDIHQWGIDQGITVITAEDAHMAGPQAVAARIAEVVGNHPAYLSFDIDALDPAFAPGTGTPEMGGLHSWQALAVLNRLAGLDWRGMDVVEVAPAFDHAEITALAAATLAWTYLSMVA